MDQLQLLCDYDDDVLTWLLTTSNHRSVSPTSMPRFLNTAGSTVAIVIPAALGLR